ncbi:hypothetical protein [Thiothrix subterranea]|uniref:GDPGP1-like N-terminal domain-containing protein n=1 Tax=Thiothrix subterranea TaxID=2735563 RepID=A0AA51R469_9GAMM|nr:hypothetical protein [Thiothrix subterranea]MDQ5769487.1 hypothetical protein [Thiothrix subterranea]WML86300.1 hypothetical protein RCG00_18650 [Thiothrix subterranea]
MLFTTSPDAFKTRFADGLQNMLTPDGLGAFILVLANSMQDAQLRQQLAKPLRETFAQLQQRQPDGPVDDVATFAALLKTGIEIFSGWEHARAEPWELVINPLRSLRPARVSSEVFSELFQPFAADKFHFNKPFLRPEILWEGKAEGMNLRVFYNKFPFAPWHTLIVPEPQATLPQFLTQPYHKRIMALAASTATYLPGFGIAFNSVGAYASVNQLHFQGFIRPSRFPVEAAQWQHNGGTQAYPLHCWRADSAQAAWEIIAALHQANQPYNLLYRAESCYILPRKGQGTVKLADWLQGIGWHELCGVFNLVDRSAATMHSTVFSDQLSLLTA